MSSATPRWTRTGRLLFLVKSNCYERQPMVLTTNIEFGKWGVVLADDKLVSMLVNRIVHHGRLVLRLRAVIS